MMGNVAARKEACEGNTKEVGEKRMATWGTDIPEDVELSEEALANSLKKDERKREEKDERKRKYNVKYNNDVTREEMEAYRMQRVHQDDLLKALSSSSGSHLFPGAAAVDRYIGANSLTPNPGPGSMAHLRLRHRRAAFPGTITLRATRNRDMVSFEDNLETLIFNVVCVISESRPVDYYYASGITGTVCLAFSPPAPTIFSPPIWYRYPAR
ncbi:unnamed protein product, partial [Arabidopsis halleri]